MMKRTSFLDDSCRRFVGLHRTIQLHLLVGAKTWITVIMNEMNRDHSVFFQIASKYCISDTFVDYEGYSISSKGFSPRVVDIMFI